MEPKEFVEKLGYFISILNETAELLNEKNISDLQVYEGETKEPITLEGWLDWASEHIGTLAIELDQNLNPSLRGDTNPNTGDRYRLE